MIERDQILYEVACKTSYPWVTWLFAGSIPRVSGNSTPNPWGESIGFSFLFFFFNIAFLRVCFDLPSVLNYSVPKAQATADSCML